MKKTEKEIADLKTLAVDLALERAMRPTGRPQSLQSLAAEVLLRKQKGEAPIEVGDIDEIARDWSALPPSVREEWKKNPLAPRAEIMLDGIHATVGARQQDYGDPAPNFACCGELKAVMRKHARRGISLAEWHALDEVCTKLGRILTGKVKRDNYVDGATYFAIAGELALSENKDRKDMLG